MRHLKLILATAVVALIVPPSTALADDFYASGTAADITAKIALAVDHPGPDTLHIAAGTYAIDNSTFPNMGGDRLDIVGAGVGQTVFTGATVGSWLMWIVLPDPSSTISGFSLQATLTSNYTSALILSRGKLRDFDVTATTLDSSRGNAVSANGGTGTPVELRDGSISVNSNNVGLSSSTQSGMTADNVEVTNTDPANLYAYGVVVYGYSGNNSLSRMTIRGFTYSFLQNRATAVLEDSLIDMQGVGGAGGVTVSDFDTDNDTTINFTGRRLTIVGSGANQTAVKTGTEPGSGTDSTTATFEDSVFWGSGLNFQALSCVGAGASTAYGRIAGKGLAPVGSGGCVITSDYWSDLGSSGGSSFVDFAAGDYRPRHSFEFLDFGTTEPGVGAKDLAGKPRVVDGDGVGGPVVDLGAFEYQRSAPVVTLTRSPDLPFIAGPITFTADASDPDGDALTYAWKVDGATSATTDAALIVPLFDVGQHQVEVTVTDETGLTASGTSGFDVQATCALIQTGFGVNKKPKKAFKRGTRGFKISKKAKQPYFEIGSSSALGAKITLKSVSSKNKLKSLKGTQTLKLKKGVNRIVFGGKWNKKKLKKGTYKVTFTPVKVGDCPATKTASVTFKLK